MAYLTDSADQRRLRWLREDLASCLREISVILHRTAGAPAGPYARRVSVELLPPGPDWPPGLPGPEDLEPHRHGPTSITCDWADGTSLTYHWVGDGSVGDAGVMSQQVTDH
jgi:hypothetical protein